MTNITLKQRQALDQLPLDGSWGIPKSTTHLGTLAALIMRGLVEWSEGRFTQVWHLRRGEFRLTTDGRALRGSVSIPSRYVICTPDHNWYGPYVDEETARYALDVLRGRYGRTIAQIQGTDWTERRPLKVATARYTSAGIAIDWPDWPKK